ncbi:MULTISPECIES: hypothetical protein [Mycobacterium]|uniref:Uncharacterized protein n=1 Tax=Mycobacterium kiyosense TaxID=2871094 RepID=A0A9P3QBY1_9MYCO|nr:MULTISPECIES: hypothetical protein [Mycobacterium]BDB44542.1 hypothetical protein IWGMT90018_49880 [Mycobacterium kiyosense]BDE16050.1 hypothetical protein MKCMC460_49100 [Mycobacterium sp. 20KCMC460]GLB85979.1 hypothetical protein SRL2020028_52350 [Mycobacterium kiyosense]GLB93034.1 hypothetical protein SRL2020130_58510 [Mycobacterium kiyosense]GLB98637.1 hypothetical protein SRL2020226_54130 [Mycobacterium kiyosense]
MVRLLACAALAGAAVTFAPSAHADRTVTASEACAEAIPGSIPVQLTFELSCQDPEVWKRQGTVPGTEPMPVLMARVFPGSFRVNPANRWSDWVIPQ